MVYFFDSILRKVLKNEEISRLIKNKKYKYVYDTAF